MSSLFHYFLMLKTSIIIIYVHKCTLTLGEVKKYKDLIITSFSKLMSNHRQLFLINDVHGYKTTKSDYKNDRPLIVISNHRSFDDILILSNLLSLDKRVKNFNTQTPNVTFIGKDELQTQFLLGKTIKALGVFFIKRDSSGFKALLKFFKTIDKTSDRKIVIFPEGTRNKNLDHTKILNMQAGAFLMSKMNGIDILPIFLDFDSSSLSSRVFDKHNDINLGKIIKSSDIEKNSDFTQLYIDSFTGYNHLEISKNNS